jgi:hypothetical protein
MNYSLGLLLGKMCPDYIHPALADAADAIAPIAETSPEPMRTPASFAEVKNFVAEFYQTIEVQTSLRSFPRLGTSGMQAHGLYWTLSSLALHSADSAYSVCSLAAILEPHVASKYYLSPRACQGILRRAEKRGRTLPPALEAALRATAQTGQDDGETTIKTLSPRSELLSDAIED